MSSLALKKYLSKILTEYETASATEREAQQRKAQHFISKDSKDILALKADIDRAQQAFDIPRVVTDALYGSMSEAIQNIDPSKQGKLTFNEILDIRKSGGVSGTAASKGGEKYNTTYLKDPRTGLAYEDPNGVKIHLKDIVQADPNEGIATIQTKVQLIKVLRYRDRFLKTVGPEPTENQSKDIKLLNLVINVFNQTLKLHEKVDGLGRLDQEIKGQLSGTGVSQRAIKQFLEGNADLKIDISSTPTVTIEKIVRHRTKEVTFVLSSDNNLAGSFSKAIKQAGANALGLAIFSSLDSNEYRSFTRIAAKQKTGNRFISKYSISEGITKEVYKNPAAFAHLKGSPSFVDNIEAELLEIISGGKIKKERIKPSKTTQKGKKESVKLVLPKIPKLKISVIKQAPLRNLAGRFTSVTSLMTLMNQMLHETIKKNMQRPNLHYQTGRFAKSVKVEGITRERDGALTAFLSYMRYPYATFEAGGKQGHKGYYPSRLINESAREIATKLTRERFMSVTIK